MIHTTGIYVIESKNFTGKVFGKGDERSWTQLLPNGNSYKFYNPIFQNNNHIKALKKVLDKKYSQSFYSLIVFGSNCNIKKIKPKEDDSIIINENKLLRSLKKEIRKSQFKFDKYEIDGVFNHLIKYSIANRKIKKIHNKEINIKYKA